MSNCTGNIGEFLMKMIIPAYAGICIGVGVGIGWWVWG